MSPKAYLIITIGVLLGRAILGSTTAAISSYTAALNVSYENGQWVCGTLECPPTETYGCRIQQQNDVDDKKVLNVVYTCFDEEKAGIMSAATSIEMAKPRRIDIDLESYVGADSVFSTGYGLGGNENAHGTISASGWNDFKATAEQNQKAVDESNAQTK